MKADGTRLAETWWHYPLWKSDAEAIGLDFEIGPKLGAYFERMGDMNNITESIYNFLLSRSQIGLSWMVSVTISFPCSRGQ